MSRQSTDRVNASVADPINWDRYCQTHTVNWHSGNNWPAPKRLQPVTTALSADQALKVLTQGTALLWEGDFHQGRQMLGSIKRRLLERLTIEPNAPMPEAFHKFRLARSQQARLLGMILIRVEPGWVLRLGRALPIEAACSTTLGKIDTPILMPLTELLGILSAHQWQLNGVEVTALQGRIYPRHGVFAPTRQEYLSLLANAPLPDPCHSAIDLGTGTGVIAAILAQRGVAQVTAIDHYAPALACAQDNIERLGLSNVVHIQAGDLLSHSPKVDLIVCNPPWLPGVVRSPLDAAVHDPEHRMLKGFIGSAAQHLNPGGQAWLIMSNLAELLGLRSREQLLQWIHAAGLRVSMRHDTHPTHAKASRQSDPLAAWRSKEITSLWQLSLAEKP